MEITTKYDIGQEVFVIFEDQIRKSRIRAIEANASKSEKNNEYLLYKDRADDIRMSMHKFPEKRVFESMESLVDFYKKQLKK